MKIIKIYSKLLSEHAYIILFLLLGITLLAGNMASKLKTGTMDYRDILPDSVEVIQANNLFADKFGDADEAKVIFMIDSNYVDSDEIRNVRDYRVLEYVEKFQFLLESSSEEIEDITSPTDMIRLVNDGNLPKSIPDIKRSEKKDPFISNYISEDGTVLIMSLRLFEGADKYAVVDDINSNIKNLEPPKGLFVNGAGSSLEEVYVQEQIGGDMGRTSAISMIGIILILLFVFASVKYAFLPLTTIIIGLIWTFGYVVFIDMSITSVTSSVMSMIMGIGIDFGIQIINRFRLERRKKPIKKAMETALDKVIGPLFTTTVAACVGFYCMGLGELSIMKDMGRMMMIGVIFCFLTAITFVPALTIVIDDFFSRIKSIGGKK